MKDYRPAIAAAQKLIDRYPGADAADPALGVDRRRALVVRAGRVPAGRAGLRAGARADAADRRPDAPALVDNLAASIYKQGEQANARRTIARRPITSCASSRRRRRRRSAPPPNTTRAPRSIRLQDWTAAASVLEAFRSTLPGPRAASARRPSRSRSSIARAASWRARPANTSASPRSRATRHLRGEALLVAGDLYEQSKARAQALAVVHALRRGVPATDRDGRRDALQDRGDAPGDARRRALPRGAAADRPHRRGSGRRAHGPHAHACGALGARARRAALRAVCGGASCASRSRRACRRRSGSWTSTLERARAARRLRGRRGHRGRDVLHGGDLSRLQPRADRVRAAGRPAGRGAGGVRARARGRGVPVRGEGHRRPREEPGAACAPGIYNAWIDKSLGKLARARCRRATRRAR